MSNRLDNLDDFSGRRRTVDEAAQVRSRLGRSSERGALGRRLEQNRAAHQIDETPALGRACNSFTEDTPVHTDEGQKSIEAIEVGDKVLAEEPDTGEQGYFEVVAVRSHPADEVLEVTLETEQGRGPSTSSGTGAGVQGSATLDTAAASDHNDNQQLNSDDATDDDEPTFHPSNPPAFQITPEHPLYVEGKGWIWAENLAIGDRLRRADGGLAKVLAIDRLALDEPQRVYNFTVKGPHTYFVLDVGVLVHNAGCGPYEGYVQHLEPYSSPQKRVVEPIPGLYEAIDARNLPPGWRILEGDMVFGDETFKFIQTEVQYIDPETGKVAQGIFQRIYRPGEKNLSLKAAYLKNPHIEDVGELPRWIDTRISFPGREGIPTTTFFTLHQMKKLGIPFGGLETVKWSEVVNNRTLLHLQWLRTRYPNAKLADLISQTHSVRYGETALIQSGHKIVPGTFRLKLADEVPISELRGSQGRPSNYADLERFYGLRKTPDDTPIIPELDIEVRVQSVLK